MDDEIYGFIESITFASDTFTVAKVKEPRKADLTCIVGPMPLLRPGETVHCKGSWKHHAQHGRQFEVKSFESRRPSDLAGIQKYLESGLIKGIGPAYAERIVEAFGTETLKVIDETPEKLFDVPGIGRKRAEQIQDCWKEQRTVRDVMIFLQGHGVSPTYAQKIFKTYGEGSIEVVKSDPYVLAKDIRGIGFRIADGIALGMGMPVDLPTRLNAGLEHALWELSNEGHTCYPEEDLIPLAAQMLNVDEDKLQKRANLLIEAGSLVRKDGKIWVKPLYLTEVGIARECARLLSKPVMFRSIDIGKAVAWVEEKLHMQLAPEQREAVAHACENKIHIITGGPGTGKSTITRAILTITSKITQKIMLAAPTGRAAKRLSEITHHRASTIHSLLEIDFQEKGFKKNKDDPLDCDMMIVDEASMVDTQLMYSLLKALPSHTRLIMIGDIDQLPSVGPGNVLKDMIASKKFSVTRLKQIFRQAADSKIVTNAHRINVGEFPDLSSSSDFIFIEKETPEEILDEIVKLAGKNSRDALQVLAPMKRGIIGTENLNVVLQKTLNPSHTPLHRMGRTFHVNDKVMQIRNNYQKFVFNGDVGRIASIDLHDQKMNVDYDGRVVSYEFSELDELSLAYAVSIHKYQGSECPFIVIPVHTTHFKMLHRNLLYTGITRGKRRVTLVGTKKALGIAVSNADVQKRFTGLEKAFLEF